ncbi:MAG TPA: crossover junction endodeoxyribonuclease RuvC [Propionibacterium sp.]|jgi:crossover junction endodeoxyribonuclease RuvC|nr:crossover junction endodeoxyribonuclease RuvC [Propionibacterium sp.]
MRVLGIDPGLTRCGFAVVEGTPGRPPHLLGVGVVRTDPALDVPRRLVTIEEKLSGLVGQWLPDVLAVERVFAQNNMQTVIATAQAAGIAMLVGARQAIPVAQYTPSEVKAAITGNGRAGKEQVGHMVARVLQLDAPPKPADAADAVALGICQVWRGQSSNRIEEALRRVERNGGHHNGSLERAAELSRRQVERVNAATRRVGRRRS